MDIHLGMSPRLDRRADALLTTFLGRTADRCPINRGLFLGSVSHPEMMAKDKIERTELIFFQ